MLQKTRLYISLGPALACGLFGRRRAGRHLSLGFLSKRLGPTLERFTTRSDPALDFGMEERTLAGVAWPDGLELSQVFVEHVAALRETHPDDRAESRSRLTSYESAAEGGTALPVTRPQSALRRQQAVTGYPNPRSRPRHLMPSALAEEHKGCRSKWRSHRLVQQE